MGSGDEGAAALDAEAVGLDVAVAVTVAVTAGQMMALATADTLAGLREMGMRVAAMPQAPPLGTSSLVSRPRCADIPTQLAATPRGTDMAAVGLMDLAVGTTAGTMTAHRSVQGTSSSDPCQDPLAWTEARLDPELKRLWIGQAKLTHVLAPAVGIPWN